MRVGAVARRYQQAALHQGTEVAVEPLGRHRRIVRFGDRAEQLQRNLATDHATQLGQWPGRTQGVEPVRQQIAHADRDRQGVAQLAQTGGFLQLQVQHHARGHFDEQRNAVRLGLYRGHHGRRQGGVTRQRLNHVAYRLNRQPVQVQAGVADRMALRRRLVQALGQNGQQRGRAALCMQLDQEIQRGGIGPLDVFHHQQQRQSARLRQHPLRHFVQDHAPTRLGQRRWSRTGTWQLQQVADGIGRESGACLADHHRVDLGNPFGHAVGGLDIEMPLQHGNDGPESARARLRRAAVGDDVGLPAAFGLRRKHRNQLGLADPGLAAQVQPACLSARRTVKLGLQRGQFFGAADQRSVAVVRPLAPAHLGACLLDAEDRCLAVKALEHLVVGKWRETKMRARQLGGGTADQDFTRRGHVLKARRQMHREPDQVHVGHRHLARGHANADLNAHAPGLGHQVQRGKQRATHCVLARLLGAEVAHDAVVALGRVGEAAPLLDDGAKAPVVFVQRQAVAFQAQSLHQRGRADHVVGQRGHLAEAALEVGGLGLRQQREAVLAEHRNHRARLARRTQMAPVAHRHAPAQRFVKARQLLGIGRETGRALHTAQHAGMQFGGRQRATQVVPGRTGRAVVEQQQARVAGDVRQVVVGLQCFQAVPQRADQVQHVIAMGGVEFQRALQLFLRQLVQLHMGQRGDGVTQCLHVVARDGLALAHAHQQHAQLALGQRHARALAGRRAHAEETARHLVVGHPGVHAVKAGFPGHQRQRRVHADAQLAGVGAGKEAADALGQQLLRHTLTQGQQRRVGVAVAVTGRDCPQLLQPGQTRRQALHFADQQVRALVGQRGHQRVFINGQRQVIGLALGFGFQPTVQHAGHAIERAGRKIAKDRRRLGHRCIRIGWICAL